MRGSLRYKDWQSYPRPCGEAQVYVPADHVTEPRVYPRPCGEAQPAPARCTASGGLSPPVRGSLAVACNVLAYSRSIPARAGKPYTGEYTPNVVPVYPRPCGEAGGIRVPPMDRKGLSPPVRGSLGGHRRGAEIRGSIPARAGKPPFPATGDAEARVYPRPCGEASCYMENS